MGQQCSPNLQSGRIDYLYEGVSWQIRSRNSKACGYSFNSGQQHRLSYTDEGIPNLQLSNYGQRKYSQFKQVPYVYPTESARPDMLSVTTNPMAAKADLKNSLTFDTQDTVPRQRTDRQILKISSQPSITNNHRDNYEVESASDERMQTDEAPQLKNEAQRGRGSAFDSQQYNQELVSYEHREFYPYPHREYRRSHQQSQQGRLQIQELRMSSRKTDQHGSNQPLEQYVEPAVNEQRQFQQQKPQSQLSFNPARNHEHFASQSMPVLPPPTYNYQQIHAQSIQIRPSKVQEPPPIPPSVQSITDNRKARFESKMREVQNLYNEHNVDFAFAKGQSLIQQFGDEINGNKHFKHILKEVNLEYKDIVGYAAEIYKNKWVEKTNQKGRKLSTCHTDKTIAVLVQGELHYPMELFLSIINELNLHKKFIPYLVLSQQEKRLGRNSKIGHCVSDFPVISKRQVFFQGAGFNRLETNSTIFMYTRSIHNRPDLLKRFNYQPQPTPGTVMLQYKYISLQCTPYNSHYGFVKLCINADMQLDYIPKWMLEAATKTFGLEFFDNVVKICKNFKGSEWDEAIQKEPDLFEFYKKCIRTYLHNKGVRQ